MFGSSKKDGFKYESEVKALIREATDQRFFALETHNQQLIQRSISLETEIVQLKNFIVNDLQRLEKRITDFTDVWHPFMIQNINRIKDELVTTIVETERQNIQKIHADLETKLVKIADQSSVGLMDHILIGHGGDDSAFSLFFHKDSDMEIIHQKFCWQPGNKILILQSLKHFKNGYYDPARMIDIKVFDEGHEYCITSLNHGGGGAFHWHDNYLQTPLLKNLYKLCKKHRIIFKVNGQDRVNGVPIKLLFEDI